MDVDYLREKWLDEEHATYEGWDYSHIEGRIIDSKPTWSCSKLIKDFLQPQDNILGFGSVCGPFLMTLEHPIERIYTTANWGPSTLLESETSAPLGISGVNELVREMLPYGDDMFDVVVSRHESYCIEQVRRVLKSGGRFVTQQVGGKNNLDLSLRLIPDFEENANEHDLMSVIAELQENGFEIEYADEQFPRLRFADVGAVVYFARGLRWEFPNFSVNACFDRLLELQKELERNGYIECCQHRLIVVARNCK